MGDLGLNRCNLAIPHEVLLNLDTVPLHTAPTAFKMKTLFWNHREGSGNEREDYYGLFVKLLVSKSDDFKKFSELAQILTVVSYKVMCVGVATKGCRTIFLIAEYEFVAILTKVVIVEDLKQELWGNFARSQTSDFGKFLFDEFAVQLMNSLTCRVRQLT